MAVYRCPKCGEIVFGEDALRCTTCGLRFDLKHEPVLDDGSGIPKNVRKKEKRAMILVAVVFVVVVVAVIILARRNAVMLGEVYRRRFG